MWVPEEWLLSPFRYQRAIVQKTGNPDDIVEFDIVKATGDSKHEFQADNISGIKGGSLMCEVQFANRPVKAEGGSAADGFVKVQPKRKTRSADSEDPKTPKKPSSYAKIPNAKK